MYNLSIGDIPMKLVGADLGKYEHEEKVDNVVIAAAQRKYIVEAKFDKPGTYGHHQPGAGAGELHGASSFGR